MFGKSEHADGTNQNMVLFSYARSTFCCSLFILNIETFVNNGVVVPSMHLPLAVREMSERRMMLTGIAQFVIGSSPHKSARSPLAAR